MYIKLLVIMMVIIYTSMVDGGWFQVCACPQHLIAHIVLMPCGHSFGNVIEVANHSSKVFNV